MSPPASTTDSSPGYASDRNSNEALDKWEEEEEDSRKEDSDSLKPPANPSDRPMKLIWSMIIIYTTYHIITAYGIYLMFTFAKWKTNAFAILLYLAANLGMTAGAHRLWSHRTYKAKLPLRIFLAFLFTISFQKNIFSWSRDHRIHHKYSETDADPHNALRGFFFSHVGWLLVRRHPEVDRRAKQMDFSDLLADPVVRFHKKYFYRLGFLLCYALPTLVPMWAWGETFANSFCVAAVFHHSLSLHTTWLVNSAAHMYGMRPYDARINPRENLLVSIGATGEGFHNYHHAFPYDYAASEFGVKYNMATAFIDLMAFLGLAYDLKTASKSTIRARKLRCGPESLKNSPANDENSSLKSD